MKAKKIIKIVPLMSLIILATLACETKTDDHVEEIDIEFSYSPDPALVDSTIEIKFEPFLVGDDHGDDDSGDDHQLEISMVTCEVGLVGGTEHHEMMLEKHQDHGEYEGEMIFDEAGTYELHFGYMYIDEMHEKEFMLEVISN